MTQALSRNEPRGTDGLVTQTTDKDGNVSFSNEDLHLSAGDEVAPSGKYLAYLGELYAEIGIWDDPKTLSEVIDSK